MKDDQKKSCFHQAKFCFLVILLVIFSCGRRGQPETFKPVSEAYEQNKHRQRLFDDDWRFSRMDINGAETVDYDDQSWRPIDLPHDWSIEDLPASADTTDEIIGPFSTASEGGRSTGHVLGGTAWYRKTFRIEPQDENKHIAIRFDGVYMNADCWINGHHLGNHPYGYTSFSYNLTPYLNSAGQKNVLAVQVKNIGQNSRWYSGSGIYRHVWLVVTKSLQLDPFHIFITTPEVNLDSAGIRIRATIFNNNTIDKAFTLSSRIMSPDGKSLDEIKMQGNLSKNSQSIISQKFKISNPQLWSIETPNLYLAEINLYSGDEVVDKISIPFGIRSLEFSAGKGFLLNGKPVLLRGGCMHHDNGPLGSATIDRAEYRRVALMKAHGFNAIRTSHNPPSSQFLDACDQLGMLVLDEAFDMWQKPKNPSDYHLYFDEWWKKDIESMVLRDRNHPSVIMWSIGNEIPERADSSGLVWADKLYEAIKAKDDTRPVTEAICSFWDHPGRSWKDTAPAFALLDIGGYNYQWRQYEPDHEAFPSRIMAGTESVPQEAFENWQEVKKNPWVIGDFVWTGMDYLGEAGIGNALFAGEKPGWPWFNANCGDIDICGFKKPQSYFRDVVWGMSNLEMAVHAPIPQGKTENVSFWGWPDERQSWTWPGEEGKSMQVAVYSTHQKVRLMLNKTLVGEQTIDQDSTMTAHFNVQYEPGELKAIGLENDVAVDSVIFQTTGRPFQIHLSADRDTIKADRNDLAYITVEVTDNHGERVPDADVPLQFEISGAGVLAGVGNANPTDMKSFQKPACTSFRGRCLVILRPLGPAGTIVLKATGTGLSPAIIAITTR